MYLLVHFFKNHQNSMKIYKNNLLFPREEEFNNLGNTLDLKSVEGLKLPRLMLDEPNVLKVHHLLRKEEYLLVCLCNTCNRGFTYTYVHVNIKGSQTCFSKVKTQLWLPISYRHYFRIIFAILIPIYVCLYIHMHVYIYVCIVKLA